jgi:hypothetical protein
MTRILKKFWMEEDGMGVVEVVLIIIDNYVSLFNYLYCLLCYYIYEIKKSIYISYPIISNPSYQSISSYIYISLSEVSICLLQKSYVS